MATWQFTLHLIPRTSLVLLFPAGIPDALDRETLDSTEWWKELNGEKFITNGNHRLFAAYATDLQTVPAIRVTLPSQRFKTAADLVEVPRSSFLKPLQYRKPGN